VTKETVKKWKVRRLSIDGGKRREHKKQEEG
jgi:hypothetical protein